MTIKNNALSILKYQFSPADNLLFDANIWLYIYGPQGDPKDFKTNVYSRALANALNARCSIFIDLLVLSEFVNSFARLEHVSLRDQGKANQAFKIFRQSPDFKPIAVNIAHSVRRILNYSHRIDDDFMNIDIFALLNEFEQGDSDFNDQVITTLCQSRGLSLVTHDADFRDRGLTVITANNRLLA